MRKLRVIVCGVGFGRYYIEAILRLPDLFELVGILSRGSKNSIKLAEKYGVPLMTDIEEISKENVDAVCVVVKSSIVGGNGTDIVMQLLEKGIHVIQEQPIHSEEYKKCLIIAKKNHCKYQLNTFYPYLDSVRKFISIAIRLRKAMPITYIIAESSVQVLFPLLDILNQILGGVQPYKLEKLQGEPLKKEIKLDFDHYPVKAYTYSFPGQYGTHVDVPAHADKTGRTLEKIQLKECVMPLCVIDCSQKVAENNDYSLKLNDIIEYEKTYCKIPTGAFVAMRSDWYKRWPNQKSFQNCDENGESHYPGWSFEAVKFLVEEREIGGIGHETFDTDPPADIMQRNFKAECYILKQDKFQIEMLANLDKVPAYGAVICCMFVKQTLGTGFPARCFAVCPE